MDWLTFLALAPVVAYYLWIILQPAEREWRPPGHVGKD
jgi:hypothetical protein